jgi:hypothetical protein
MRCRSWRTSPRGQEAKPPGVDMFAQTFSVAGEDQEKAVLSSRGKKNHPLVLFNLVGAAFKFDEDESDQNKST